MFHPGEYWSNSRAILEDRRISTKSIAEQLGISLEWVGFIIYEDLNMRKLYTKWAPKCLNANQKRQSGQSSEQIWNFRRARSKWVPVGRDCWPWRKPGYITVTRRQSNNQWIGGIAAHPAPKNSECNNPLGKFSPRFFGIKTASSTLIIFQRAKLSTRSITHLCWCNWRTFWRKKAAGSSPRVSCSCTTMSQLTAHLQPSRKWPICFSNILTTTCFLNWKKQLKVRHFSSDAGVIAAAETWLEGQYSDFFWVACKS